MSLPSTSIESEAGRDLPAADGTRPGFLFSGYDAPNTIKRLEETFIHESQIKTALLWSSKTHYQLSRMRTDRIHDMDRNLEHDGKGSGGEEFEWQEERMEAKSRKARPE